MKMNKIDFQKNPKKKKITKNPKNPQKKKSQTVIWKKTPKKS